MLTSPSIFLGFQTKSEASLSESTWQHTKASFRGLYTYIYIYIYIYIIAREAKTASDLSEEVT